MSDDGGIPCLIDERWRVAHRLERAVTHLGRDTSNAIVIRDPAASRFHADVRREGDAFVLHTTGTSVTRVNGTDVTVPHVLAEADRIEIAHTTLRFTRRPLEDDVEWGTRHASLHDALAISPTMRTPRVRRPAAARRRWMGWAAVLVLLAILAWAVTRH